MALNYDQINFPPYPESDLPVCPKVIIDPTLSILGRAADAKVTGDGLKRKMDGEDILRSLSLVYKPEPTPPNCPPGPFPPELPHVEVDGFMEADQLSFPQKQQGGLTWRTLANVAFTGDYKDLSNRPDDEIAQLRADLNGEATRSRDKDAEHDTKIAELRTDVDILKTTVTQHEQAIKDLQVGLAQETQDRKDADALIQATIAVETAARIAADQELDENIHYVNQKLDNHISESDGRLVALEAALPIKEFQFKTVYSHLTDLYANDTALNKALDEEIDRAEKAEAALDREVVNLNGRVNTVEVKISNVEQNVTRLDGSVSRLETNLNSEITTRANADTQLRNQIMDETSLRQSADSLLGSQISAEKDRALAQESAILSELRVEESRAAAKEDELSASVTEISGKLTKEINDRVESCSGLAVAISSVSNIAQQEITRATSRENGILTELRAEEERAKEKELDLTNALDSEVTRAKAKEVELNTAITDEVTRAKSKETELGSSIQSANDEINLIKATLNNEITRSVAKDAELEATKVTANVGELSIFNETAGAGIMWQSSSAQASNAYVEIVTDDADKRIAIHNDNGSHSASIFANASGAYYVKDTEVIDDYHEIAVKGYVDEHDLALSDRIKNLEARGRFLSCWDCQAGKPETEPSAVPYLLKAGDYFIVSRIATSNNRRPEAKLIEGKYYYDGSISLVEETEAVEVNDFYIFEGTKYVLLKNTQGSVSFLNIVGDARDNTSLLNEFTALETADTTLQTNIDNEAQARSDMDVTLANLVSTEEARAKAVEALKVNTSTIGPNGTAYIFNESDGGGSKFVHNDGTESFVGVNDGGANGLVAQIYADKLVSGKWSGAKLDIYNDGMYYTVGDKSAAERKSVDNELAVKKDVADEATARTTADTALENQLKNKPDKEITSTSGKSLIFNEADGGGAKFETSDTWSYVGVNNGGSSGIAAQIYAVDASTKNGVKLDVYRDGIYYTNGNQSAADRHKEENRLAVQKDLPPKCDATDDGEYIYTCTITDGNKVYSWVKKEIAKEDEIKDMLRKIGFEV